MIAIFIMWMISFIGIIIWGKRPYIVNKIDVELPQTFLKLNSEFRKKSLDLAWKLGLSQASSIPFRTISNKAGSALILLFCSFLSCCNVICGLAIMSNSNPSAQSSPGLLLFTLGSAISLILLHKYYSKKKDNEQTSEEERANNLLNKKLKNLGIQFVQNNYSNWTEEMDNITKPKAIMESQVKDEISFTLYSNDYSLTPSGMPSKSLGVTHLFSNGFVSVVSGIIYDLRQTSYGYVNSDHPIYSYNSSSEWNTEEFHYSDVVEVTYKPSDGSNNSIHAKDSEYPIEGYLILSLVNSSIKKYPTTKKGVANFINMARERVRNAKRSK